MTQQGLIHLEKGRFEKKDQNKIEDRRQWNLGFSNKSRLAILNQEKNHLTSILENTKKQLDKARKDLDAITTQKSLWEKIKTFIWGDINATLLSREIMQS